MFKKKRHKLLSLSGILVLGLILYFKPFSSTEFIILNNLTEYTDDGVAIQIVLVKKPPYFSSVLEDKIAEFDKLNSEKHKYFRRLFIKEHDNDFLGGFFLQKDIDYQSKNIESYEIDNIDFLAKSVCTLNFDGSITKGIECYTGELWYYKY